MKSSDHTPRSTRIDVNYEAVLITSDDHEIRVTVKDLSRGGFRIEHHDQLLVGERVRLRVGRDGEHAGEIRWALGSEAGGVFVESNRDPEA